MKMLLSLLLPTVLGMPTSGPTTLSPTRSPSTLSPSSISPTTTVPTASPTIYVPPCERNLTMTQIANMISLDPGSCPVIIRDYHNVSKVYEMRDYGHAHPHGSADILHFCGTDMTVAFETGPHNWIPFEGDRGRVGGVNRSVWFQCVGTFLPSTPSPTPPTTTPGVNVSVYPCLTLGKEYQIRQAVLNKFNSLPLTKLNAERAAFNGGVVRLAFHDAATYSRVSDDGGPDGCINTDDPDNAGLKIHMDTLEELWLPFKDRISRADFWYLAAVTAIEHAGGPKIKFRYGRKDCTPATRARDNTQGRLPLPNRNWFYVRGVFNYALGFSDREITALMGAHVLGKTHPENSGFSGPWVSGPSPGMHFSNQFYLGLQTVEWVKTKNNFTGFSGREQWNQEGLESTLGSQMFLTSDVVLLLSNADDPACTSSLIDQTKPVDTAMPKDPQCIKNKDTYHIVNEYSNDQASFYRDFAVAYQKLCELGYKNGTLIEPGTCFPGAIEFLNDPPVPTPAALVGDETIGGMPVAGFAVLIVVLLLLLIVAIFLGRHCYLKRALQPLNETETELIKQTTATKAKARSPSRGGKDRKPTIVVSTEPVSAPESGQVVASAQEAPAPASEPASEAPSPVSPEPASGAPVDPLEPPALPATLPKGVSAFVMTDEPVS